jgi:hypothetical protein
MSSICHIRQCLAPSLQQPTGTWTHGFRSDLARRLTNDTSAADTIRNTYTPLCTDFSVKGSVNETVQ